MRRIISCINLLCSTIFLSLVAIAVSFFDNKGVRGPPCRTLLGRLHLKVSGIKVVVKGLERLTNPPYVFMCNHQSALDIYTLLAFLPYSFKWIAKRQLFRIPFIGWAMGRTGYISIDRENPREALKAIEEAARKIRNGMNIVIFPEGTRSVDGTLLPFKKGGFTLALRAMVPIVPIGIYGTSQLQPKGSFIPKEKGVIYIHIGEPIILEGMDRSAKTKVMDDVRSAYRKVDGVSGELKKEILGIGLLGVFLFLLVSLLSYHPLDPSFHTVADGSTRNLCGKAGSYLSDFLIQAFGMMSYLLAIFIFVFAGFYVKKKDPPNIIVFSSGLALFVSFPFFASPGTGREDPYDGASPLTFLAFWDLSSKVSS